MASISLRVYNHEIEGMIEHGQIDEAIAHCLHILQSIPKHIGTYRLLGKAFLEVQRYGDAADIFQRVLSSVPDDFVANVGMSIIREDEGNLDSAIWYMERAFESQPSNVAIQEELRRLYGRRDGLEPPKVRLSRGALARMYSRGHLYQQAIGELRAALAEEPQRPDLLVLLSHMYYLAGQRAEAADTANMLIKKLPFCLEASRILSIFLSETQRLDEAQSYQQRVVSLDPYFKNAQPKQLSSDDVPDQAVVVEKLDYKPGETAGLVPTQPTWASSLGIQLEETKKGTLPEWLTVETTETAPLQPQTEAGSEDQTLIVPPQTRPEPSKEDLIPDWMKEAGWTPSDRKTEQPPPPEDYTAEPALGAGELTPGEVPDWLREMAPSGMLDETAAPLETPQGELPTWLEETPPGSSDTVINWLEEKQPQAPRTEPLEELAPIDEEIPDWLKDLQPESHAAPVEQPSAQEQPETEASVPDWFTSTEPAPSSVPDWLAELKPETPSDEAGVNQPPSDETLISAPPADVLSSGEEISRTVEPVQPAEEIPDWLLAMQTETPAEGAPTPVASAAAASEVALPAEEIPDWLKEMQAETPETETPTLISATPVVPSPESETPGAMNLEEQGEALAWLEGLASKQGVPEDQLTTRPETRPEIPPEWITPTEQPPKEQVETQPVSVPEEPEPALPDWALGLNEPAEAQDVKPALPADGIPDWLLAMQAEAPGEESAVRAIPEPEAALPAESIPDWLKAMQTETPVEEIQAPVQAETVPPAEAALPAEGIPDWLLAMQSETPAEEPQAEVAPEPEATLPPEGIPDWLKAMQEETLAEEMQAPVPAEAGPEPEAALPSEGIPDWLKAMQEETPTEVRQAPVPAEAGPEPEAALPSEGIPDWLKAMQEETPAEEKQVPAQAEAAIKPEAALPEEEIPDWLKAFEASPSEGEQPTLIQAAPVESVQVPETPSGVNLEEPDAAMAWLESLASKQGVPEDQLTTKPEERPEKPPEWILESAGPTESLPTTEKTPPEEHVPDWLREIEAETHEEETSTIIQAVPVTPTPVEGIPEPMNIEDEAAMAWLESLASKQGVPEEQLTTRPEERPETPPEWVLETGGKSEQPAEPAAEVVPDWLKQAEEVMPVEMGDTQPSRLIPQPTDETPAVTEGIPANLEGQDAAMAWLESLASKQGVPEEQLTTSPEQRPEQPPDWVMEKAAEPLGEPLPMVSEPVGNAAEDLPDWLKEQLALTKEADRVEPVVPPANETPDWLKAVEEEEPQPTPVEAIEPEEAPTWLKMEAPEESIPTWISQPLPEEEKAEEMPWTPPPSILPFPVPINKVDLNQASLNELEGLPGIGFIMAQSILAHRDTNGPFSNLDDLGNVPGITPAMINELEPWLVVTEVQPVGATLEERISEPKDEDEKVLMDARGALSKGNTIIGGELLAKLVKKGLYMQEIASDLQEALYNHPKDILLWQLLGDVQFQNNRLQEALDAYTKAEELLR